WTRGAIAASPIRRAQPAAWPLSPPGYKSIESIRRKLKEAGMSKDVREVVEGKGYAAASLDGMGDGPGFRKIRRLLGVTAFGINAVVLPDGFETGWHYHDEQEETYFVHEGRGVFEFGD